MPEFSRLNKKARQTARSPVEQPSAKETLDLKNADLLDLQRTIGNQAVNRLLVQNRIGIDNPPVRRASKDQATTSAPAKATSSPALKDKTTLSDAERDEIAQQEITSLLEKFQNISVQIPGTTPPKTVTFHAAYFIHSERSSAYRGVMANRKTSNFDQIKNSVNASGKFSLIDTEDHGAYPSGEAVEWGKAMPEDVRQFVQKALDDGTIQNYAIQTGKLPKEQKLSDLDKATTEVIQDWVTKNGVGVDCSGFVLQAAIRIREAERKKLRDELGVPEEQLPPEEENKERNAASFKMNKVQITKPEDLRPGNVWVLHDEKHVKIISEVKRATNANGKPIIEFQTAESMPQSNRIGPTQSVEKTKSLTEFGVEGSFYQL